MTKKIGVLTSGGDASGMNAAIRAVVRSGLTSRMEIYGIYDGFLGLTQGNIKKLDRYSVSNVINRGGTFLGSSRFPEFKEHKVRLQSLSQIEKVGLDALIVIGGDGSYKAAKLLTEMGCPCIGIPATIDNDVPGTNYTIGFDTALNVIIDAIDKLRDTSISHHRIAIVEVMGRFCGDLALWASIAGGAEYLIMHETGGLDQKSLITDIKKGIIKQKRHQLVVITEHITDIKVLAKTIEQETQHECRATELGHIQRGGAPTACDRMMATQFGDFAIQLIKKEVGGVCVGVDANKLIYNDINRAIDHKPHHFNQTLYDLSKRLF